MYINDLPKTIEHKAVPILFADHISILVTSPNIIQLLSDRNIVFEQLNKWFKSNLLLLNVDKTHFIQFNNKIVCTSVTQIKYEGKQISIANETKFIGLYINNNNNTPLWSSGQSFWLQIQRSRVRFPALPDFLSSSGSGKGSTQPREVN